ncbi:MAG TPA: hypothetical protein VN673_18555 [Clostridia bacterium]|nr:hypothetical protein [Clostridia bacterium]
MNSIATLELMEIRPDGERRPIRAEVGAPRYDQRGSWACPVLLTGIDGAIKEIHGEDSMQALCLALGFIHTRLYSLLQQGSRLINPLDVPDSPSDPDFSLQAYFANLGNRALHQKSARGDLEIRVLVGGRHRGAKRYIATPMIAFEVHVNRKKICTAGVGDLGVLTTSLAWRGKGGPPAAEYLRLDAGGLADSGEHLRWLDRKLKRGDVVSIKVVEVDSVDKPRERHRLNPAADLRRQKQYVRRMAKKFGWKIQT